MSLFKQTGCFVVIIFMFCLNAAQADSSFPRGCEVTGFGFNNNYLILNE